MSALADSWLATAVGSRVHDFYQAIGITLRGEGSEAQVSCFGNPGAHNRDDRNPSCSVNLINGLYKCHGCGTQGNAYQAALAQGYSEQRAAELARQHNLFLEAAPDPEKPKERLPDERKLRLWRGLLRCAALNRPDDPAWTPQQLNMSRVLLDRLWELKGWTPAAVVRCGLGWDGERITFTVRDKKLKRVGVMRYLPGDARKMIARQGSKRGLFPAPETMCRKYPLFLVEGETKVVSLRSCGLQAVAIPGAGAWRMEYMPRLAPFRVTFLADCDQSGRTLARQVQAAMPRAKVIDIDPGRDDGMDVGDLVAEAAREDALGQVRRWLSGLAA